MKYKQVDLIMQYAIDAQNSETPWEFYEWYTNKFNSWKQCKNLPDVLATIFPVRRKPDAPQFDTENVCEWVSADNEFNDYKRTCDNEPRYLGKPKRYCPDCGGKVKIKERMCSIAGIEFPVPVSSKEGYPSDFFVDFSTGFIKAYNELLEGFREKLYSAKLAQRTREGAEQQLAAMKAALKQAITSAK